MGQDPDSANNNQVVWTSYDEGESFIQPVQISSGFAAYSVVGRLANSMIGLIYEPATSSGASYGGIMYYNFDLVHLEGAEHAATMSHGTTIQNKFPQMNQSSIGNSSVIRLRTLARLSPRSTEAEVNSDASELLASPATADGNL